MEANLGKKIPEDHPVIAWMVKHAAATMNRFQVGRDGKTAYRRLKGRNFKRQYVKMGEAVWFLKPKTEGKNKGESRWGEGIWLGIREESGEYIIGTQKGVIKVRTIRRRGSHQERWKF